MLEPKTRVGRYEVVGELGRGGMAVVYEALHVELGKTVALKELVLGAADAHLAERFLREARTSGSLSHPNIVSVFDYFEQRGLPYIAEEYVAGGSLRPLVGRLTRAQIAGVLEGVLAGLAHAERHGIVHRDLKPENLLVTAEGLIKIADFGIAKAVDRTAVGNSLTAAGMTIGTPTYMAPEQARAERVGPAADLYSLGVIAYELLTGGVPFGDPDTPMAAILIQHISQPVPDPLARQPDLDPELAGWVLRMLAKEPAGRPAGAAQAWDELEPIVLRLLGPMWRREAPLPVPAPRASVPPAPFETPPPADGDGGYATYAPHQAVPADDGAATEPVADAAPPPPAPADTPPAPAPADAAPPPPAPADTPPPPAPADAAPPPPAPAYAAPPTPPPSPAPAEAAAPAAPPPPPTPAQAGPPAREPAAAAAAAEAATAEPAVAGGPPSAAEPPAAATTRRSPLAAVLLVAAVAVLVVAAVLGLSDSGTQGSKPPNASTPTPTATSTPTASALTEEQVVDRIGAILTFSKQGRDLRAAGNLDAALTNRKETLRRVKALQGQTDLLQNQLRLLETAANKTVDAVEGYIRCGGDQCAPQATHASAVAKTAFARSFNSLAQRYLNRTYDATDF